MRAASRLKVGILATILGLVPAISYADVQDVGVIGIDSFADSEAFHEPRSITVVVKNFSLIDSIRPRDFLLQYRINGGAWVSQRSFSSTPISVGGSISFTFNQQVDMVEAGDYLIEARTVLGSDEDTSNDQFSVTATISPVAASSTVISSFPYSESFEAGDGDWQASVYGNGTIFERNVPSGTYKTGAKTGTFAFTTGTGAFTLSHTKTQVVSPVFDLRNLQFAEVGLSVLWETPGGVDGARLDYSTDNGETWEIVGAAGDPNNWYTKPTVTALNIGNGSTAGWTGYFTSGGSSTPYASSGYTTAGGLGSGGYVDAKNVVPGGALTRFRLVYAGSSASDEGFAFDDFTLSTGGSALLSAALQADANSDGVADPGDTIRFTAVVSNQTVSNPFTTSMFTVSSIAADLALAAGSVTTTAGTITSGNGVNDTTVAVDTGTLAQGTSVTITYDLTVLSNSSTFSTACSQGTFTSDQFTSVTNDASTQVPADQTCIEAADANGSLVYSGSTFTEAAANDGTISNTIGITVSGDTFTISSGALVEGSAFSITGLPAGLTAAVNVTSATTAELALTGSASSNDLVNSITNLTLTFLNPAFSQKKASKFTGAVRVFSVNFEANPTAIPTPRATSTPVGVVSSTSPKPKVTVRNGTLVMEIVDKARGSSRDYYVRVVRESDGRVIFKKKFKIRNGKGRLVLNNVQTGTYRVFTVTRRNIKPKVISSGVRIIEVL